MTEGVLLRRGDGFGFRFVDDARVVHLRGVFGDELFPAQLIVLFGS